MAAVFAFMAFSRTWTVVVWPRARSRSKSGGMITPASIVPSRRSSVRVEEERYMALSLKLPLWLSAATRSRLSSDWLSSTIPSRTLATAGFITEPNNSSWKMGGRTSDMMIRRSRLIWFSSFCTSARRRCDINPASQDPMTSDLELHSAHPPPAQTKEQRPGDTHRADLVPDRGPAPTLQKRIAHDFDVVAGPDEVRQPSQTYRNVAEGEHQP